MRRELPSPRSCLYRALCMVQRTPPLTSLTPWSTENVMDLDDVLMRKWNLELRDTRLYVGRARAGFGSSAKVLAMARMFPFLIKMSEASGPDTVVSRHRTTREVRARLVALGLLEPIDPLSGLVSGPGSCGSPEGSYGTCQSHGGVHLKRKNCHRFKVDLTKNQAVAIQETR